MWNMGGGICDIMPFWGIKKATGGGVAKDEINILHLFLLKTLLQVK